MDLQPRQQVNKYIYYIFIYVINIPKMKLAHNVCVCVFGNVPFDIL